MTLIGPRMTDRSESGTSRIPVWDFPTRLFHWSLVALIAFCWWSAEEEYLEWHLWSGYAVLFALLFRLLWGVVGSSTARFTAFIRGPRKVFAYLKNSRGWRVAGHSPLGALSVIGLLAVIALSVATGLVLFEDDGFIAGPLASLVNEEISDEAEDLHELLFNVLLGLIGLHIAAILYYRLVHRKRLVRAMLTGFGDYPTGTPPMVAASAARAIACALIAAAGTYWIIVGAPPLGG